MLEEEEVLEEKDELQWGLLQGWHNVWSADQRLMRIFSIYEDF